MFLENPHGRFRRRVCDLCLADLTQIAYRTGSRTRSGGPRYKTHVPKQCQLTTPSKVEMHICEKCFTDKLDQFLYVLKVTE